MNTKSADSSQHSAEHSEAHRYEIKNSVRERRRAEFLSEQTRCCLCGTELKFQHALNFVSWTIVEHVQCPECKIALKSKEHPLH